MKLTAGSAAIDFTAKDIYGAEIKLSDYKGQKILLGFFRNVYCPFCNLRVHQLSKLRETFESKNLKMIFLFESKPELMLKSSFHQGVSPIPLIGDPQKTVYNQYGVEASTLKFISTFIKPSTFRDLNEAKKLDLPQKEKDSGETQNLMPADFLIDENFRIAAAHYGSNVNDHIDVETVKKFAGI